MELINDLESRFLLDYNKCDELKDVAKYGYYYLGSIILVSKGTEFSIIDGQQRITTLTLLMIYLQNLQKEKNIDRPINLSSLISDDDYGFTPNIGVEDWAECLEALYDQKENYQPTKKGESIDNLISRYNEIDELLSEVIRNSAMKHFITWIKRNVIFSQIITYSDEDAYKVFEAMNDRGLPLTYTEMLKGYLLVKIQEEHKINELNQAWKQEIYGLNELRVREDLNFFKAFLRAKYAETIRQGRKGAANEDFEKIGTSFHRWVMHNEKRIGLNTRNQSLIFLEKTLPFYMKWYKKTVNVSWKFDEEYKITFYIYTLNLAESIYFPLLLAPIRDSDDKNTIKKKIALVSAFLEIFVVFRCVNRRNYGQSSIRYTMFSMVKEIRNKTIKQLIDIFEKKYDELDEKLEDFDKLILHGQNKRFIKFFLARITRYIEEECGIQSGFAGYMTTRQKKPFEIEHIWCNDYDHHKSEFEQRDDFRNYRNKVGALLLVPNGFNQSYSDLPYKKKLPHYIKHNLLCQSLHDKCYKNNPTFLGFIEKEKLKFKPHSSFNKEDVDKRQNLYKSIAEKIWNRGIFRKIAKEEQ